MAKYLSDLDDIPEIIPKTFFPSQGIIFFFFLLAPMPAFLFHPDFPEKEDAVHALDALDGPPLGKECSSTVTPSRTSRSGTKSRIPVITDEKGPW